LRGWKLYHIDTISVETPKLLVTRTISLIEIVALKGDFYAMTFFLIICHYLCYV